MKRKRVVPWARREADGGVTTSDEAPGPAVSCDLKVDLEHHLVGLFFGRDIASIVWTPEQAEALAKGLLEHAKTARGTVQ